MGEAASRATGSHELLPISDPNRPRSHMAGLKLDGAGTAKMATLEAAMNHLQRLHSTVEQCAVAVKGKQPAAPFIPQIRRYAHPMVGLLKGQFGMIAELVDRLPAVIDAQRGQ